MHILPSPQRRLCVPSAHLPGSAALSQLPASRMLDAMSNEPPRSAFASGFKGALGVVFALVFLPLATCGGCLAFTKIAPIASEAFR